MPLDGRRETFLERPLPSSDDSERAILGAILLDNEIMPQAIEGVTATDFYGPLHRKVFTAMLALHTRGAEINPIVIGAEMEKDGNSVNSIGGVATITNLTYGLPRFTNIEQFTKLVREKSQLRQLIRACNEITERALAEEDEAQEVFAEAQTRINNLCLEAETGKDDGYFVPLQKVIDGDVMQALKDLRQGHRPKIKTGFELIDKSIGGGLSLSDVIVIIADTGAGKSALALQMAYQIAKQGLPVGFLAGEMTNEENVLRLLSQLSGMTNLNSLQHISEGEYQTLVEWANTIKTTPLRFDHRIFDMHTLRTHLRSLVRQHGLKVLVLDYLQLFKNEKNDQRGRNERIAEMSQEVKRLAAELKIAIIEVVQMNREGAKSARAGLHDADGSGQIEKDASIYLILETAEDERIAGDGRKYRDAKIRIVKGRNVGTSLIEGRYYGRSVQFEF